MVYQDTATIHHSDDPAIIIPIEESTNQKILSGNYWPHICIIEDPWQVELADPKHEGQSCILKLETKNEQKGFADFYFDVYYDEIIQKFSENQKPLCNLNLNEDAKVSEKLKKWFESLTFEVPKEQHIVLQMRQETGIPQSGEKLVSNFVFNNETISPSPFKPPATFNVTLFEKENAQAYVNTIGFDADNKLHGLVRLKINQARNFKSKLGFDLNGVSFISMVYKHGEVEGPVMLTTMDRRASLVMVRNGIRHGPSVYYGTVPILPVRRNHS